MNIEPRQALKLINDILDQTDIRSSSTDDNGIEYDENGFSTMTEHGGVRIKDVDELIDSWINSGDQVKKMVGESQDRYMVWRQRNVNYLPSRVNQIISNQNRIKMTGENIDDLYEFRPYYYNIETKERQWERLTLPQIESGKWRFESKRLIGQIANHAILVDGNNSEPESTRYDKFVKNIPRYVLKRMEADEKRLRSAGARKAR